MGLETDVATMRRQANAISANQIRGMYRLGQTVRVVAYLPPLAFLAFWQQFDQDREFAGLLFVIIVLAGLTLFLLSLSLKWRAAGLAALRGIAPEGLLD